MDECSVISVWDRRARRLLLILKSITPTTKQPRAAFFVSLIYYFGLKSTQINNRTQIENMCHKQKKDRCAASLY
ncbi:hypothetical protein THOG05_160065 [Vibrio rotiferianus]|nr:hypothetical protein THOG05_160065 [Vibrio rotiferianus]